MSETFLVKHQVSVTLDRHLTSLKASSLLGQGASEEEVALIRFGTARAHKSKADILVHANLRSMRLYLGDFRSCCRRPRKAQCNQEMLKRSGLSPLVDESADTQCRQPLG